VTAPPAATEGRKGGQQGLRAPARTARVRQRDRSNLPKDVPRYAPCEEDCVAAQTVHRATSGDASMPLMKWSENLHVGIPRVDEQHKRLVQMVNDLYDALQEHCTKEVIGFTLDELLAYTQNHFAMEEEYFDKFGYLDAAKHKDEHLALTEEVRGLISLYKLSEGDAVGVPLLEFLKKWLYNHILISDKKYAPFLKACGAQ
jgi:hemerythrin